MVAFDGSLTWKKTVKCNHFVNKKGFLQDSRWVWGRIGFRLWFVSVKGARGLSCFNRISVYVNAHYTP
jgi:hypothetical protein